MLRANAVGIRLILGFWLLFASTSFAAQQNFNFQAASDYGRLPIPAVNAWTAGNPAVNERPVSPHYRPEPPVAYVPQQTPARPVVPATRPVVQASYQAPAYRHQHAQPSPQFHQEVIYNKYGQVRQAAFQTPATSAPSINTPPQSMANPSVGYDPYQQGFEQIMPQQDPGYFSEGPYMDGNYVNGPSGNQRFMNGGCGRPGCKGGSCLFNKQGSCIGGLGLAGANAYIGVEATFLSPTVGRSVFQVEPSRFQRGDVGTPVALDPFIYRSDVEYFTAAPRVWLGFRKCDGWGLQARYWEAHWNRDSLDQDLLVFDPELIDNNFGATTYSSLNLQAFDIEAAKDFCNGCREYLVTFGLRHARYEQSDSVSTATFIDDLGDLDLADLYTQQSVAYREFSGDGLTFSLSGNRPIGNDKDLTMFWSARGSSLWGENRAEAATALTGTFFIDEDIGDIDLEADRDVQVSDQTLFIGEIQLGCRYSCLVKGFNARAFGQFAFEYQYWNAPGANAAVVETVGNIDNSQLVSSVSTGSLDASLAGFTLSAGFTR